MGGTDSIRSGWLGWLDAWRGLADNPFAKYLLLSQRRQRESVPLWRRSPPTWLGGALGLFLSFVVIQPQDTAYQFLLAVTGNITAIAFVGWVIHGVYDAVSSSVQLLSRGMYSRGSLALDDAVLICPISATELLGGALFGLARPLWVRVMLLALVTTINAIVGFQLPSRYGGYADWTHAGDGWGEFFSYLAQQEGRQAFFEYLTTLPWDKTHDMLVVVFAPSALVTAILACAVIILIMVCLGRGLPTKYLGPAAGIATALFMAVYSAFCGVFVQSNERLGYDISRYLTHNPLQFRAEYYQVAMLILSCALFGAAVCILLKIAHKSEQFRLIALAGFPIGLTCLLAVLGYYYISSASSPGYISYPMDWNARVVAKIALHMCGSGFCWAMGALNALPSPWMFFFYFTSTAPARAEQPSLSELLLFPSMFILQIVLLSTIWRIALSSIGRHRQNC